MKYEYDGCENCCSWHKHEYSDEYGWCGKEGIGTIGDGKSMFYVDGECDDKCLTTHKTFFCIEWKAI